VPFKCTVAMARYALGIRPANLANVCRRLGIPLTHHHAESDALACARIVLAAREAGGRRASVPADLRPEEIPSRRCDEYPSAQPSDGAGDSSVPGLPIGLTAGEARPE